MNTFSNMEINDLLDNRFRLEEKHTPNYLAECFQRLFPTLGRMGLSTVIDEMARANHRAFNSSKLPIRGETLDLRFFFDLWKREFRFEGGIYDKFTFGDELKLAFRINPREFWEVLVRADREIGNYLKDCFELFQYRELPQEISFTLRAGGGSLDYKDASKIKDLLPRTNSSLIKLEDIAKACISIWGIPKFFDERRVVEELCRENNIRRAGISSSMTREPCTPFPLKNIANLRVDFLKRAAEDRFRENQKIEELSFKEFEIQKVEVPTNSLPTLSQQELLLRGDYRGHGDPVEPAYQPDRMQAMHNYEQLMHIVQTKKGVNPLSELENIFEHYIIQDLVEFKKSHPQHEKPVTISDSTRTREQQADRLMAKWKKGILSATYKGQPLYPLMEAKPYSGETVLKALSLARGNNTLLAAVQAFFDSPTDINAGKIFYLTASSDHMKNRAVDISGNSQYHSHEMKKDLVEFLNNKGRYTMFLYKYDAATYTAEGGRYRLYKGSLDDKPLDITAMWINLARDNNWFFHVQ